MYVINPHGRKVSITEEMWKTLKSQGFQLVDEVIEEEKAKEVIKMTPKVDYSSLTWKELKKLATSHKISTHSKTRKELEAELQRMEG